ncbi:MAG: class I SAM-dependent methyltransferase [Saprospiraceae bacterium]
MNGKSFLLLFILSIFFACKSKPAETTFESTHSDSPPASPDIELAEPVLYTPSSRVAWQKPGLILDQFGHDLTNKTIADIGAGPTGFFTFYLAQKGAHVVAIDIDPGALSYIEKEKIKLDTSQIRLVKTRLAKPEDPNLHDNEIDGILIVNTITYIQDKPKYLRTLQGKLKEGGRLIVVDFKMKRIPDNIAPSRSQRIYSDVLEEMLYHAGFENIVVDDQTLDYQYIIIADK